METVVGPVVAVDMSKSHHLLVVYERRSKMISVDCVDCLFHSYEKCPDRGKVLRMIEENPRVQLLSWVDVND